MSVVKAAWAQRREDPRERTRREQDVSQSVDRHPTTVTSIKPGWAGRASSWGVGCKRIGDDGADGKCERRAELPVDFGAQDGLRRSVELSSSASRVSLV